MDIAKTLHKLIFSNSQNMSCIKDLSIDLVVTSPPYPMIAMWDDLFSKIKNPKIGDMLIKNKGKEAFELMHLELDRVWLECYRVLKEGGFLCINVGDATRTIGFDFRLYSNHSRILQVASKIGFNILPIILWRKQTNAPNKFMGSGMLGAGAYVTLEHEYILILRKGSKREFKDIKSKDRRRESAFFWEERNIWFSDLWDFKGIRQELSNSKLRSRSGAYPFELAYRLINMYSIKGDKVFDPFLGTGTTTIASIASERNSIGFEIDYNLSEIITQAIMSSDGFINQYIKGRLERHNTFVKKCQREERVLRYNNHFHKFPVMTKQEANIKLHFLRKLIEDSSYSITALYI